MTSDKELPGQKAKTGKKKKVKEEVDIKTEGQKLVCKVSS